MGRPPRTVLRHEQLPRDIELAATAVLEKEIELQRRLEGLKRSCELNYDYSPFAAYRAVDRYNSGRIDTYNLGAFLRQCGHYASEMELLAIVRRIDTDGDASITYAEFAEFVRPISPAPRPLAYAPPPRPASPQRSFASTSPLKSSAAARSMSMERPRTSPYATPPRSYPPRGPTLRVFDEDELVRALKE